MLDRLIKRFERAGPSPSDAISLVKKILAEVKSKNPQLELKFDLNDK